MVCSALPPFQPGFCCWMKHEVCFVPVRQKYAERTLTQICIHMKKNYCSLERQKDMDTVFSLNLRDNLVAKKKPHSSHDCQECTGRAWKRSGARNLAKQEPFCGETVKMIKGLASSPKAVCKAANSQDACASWSAKHCATQALNLLNNCRRA